MAKHQRNDLVPKPHVIRFRSIVWADVNDPNTGNPVGEHAVVVLTKQADIDAGKPLIGAVCTTSFSTPLPSGWFPMPSLAAPDGHPVTGLNQACVVKATWIEPIRHVNRFHGKECPTRIVKQIEQWLRDKLRDKRRAEATPPKPGAKKK